jgi:hypothetical protein
MIDQFCATSFHCGPLWHEWFGEMPQKVWKPTNPLASELNTQCDVQQTIFQRGLHYKGHCRPLAIPIIHYFEYHTVLWVQLMIGTRDLIYWNVKCINFICICISFTYINLQHWRNKSSKRTSQFLKDCYIFAGVPVFNPLCKYPPVSWKFHSLGLVREKVL